MFKIKWDPGALQGLICDYPSSWQLMIQEEGCRDENERGNIWLYPWTCAVKNEMTLWPHLLLFALKWKAEGERQHCYLTGSRAGCYQQLPVPPENPLSPQISFCLANLRNWGGTGPAWNCNFCCITLGSKQHQLQTPSAVNSGRNMNMYTFVCIL